MSAEKPRHQSPRVHKKDAHAQQHTAPTERQPAGLDVADEDETLLAQLIPQLSLAIICFAAGALVGYQYGLTCQPGRLVSSRTQEELETEAEEDWNESRVSAKRELRSSGVAVAAAIEKEAEVQSQGKVYPSADAPVEGSPGPCTMADTTEDAVSSLRRNSQPKNTPTAAATEEAAVSVQQEAEEELPFVHVQTPNGRGMQQEAASPCTPAISTPDDDALRGASSEAGAATDASSRRLTGAAEVLHSPVTFVEERVGRSGECSGSGQGAIGFVDASAAVGLQHMRWVLSSGDGAQQRPQLEHWDEATAFWAAFSRQLKINPEALSTGERVQLAGVLLQAWTAFQQKGHHQETSQLRAEANTHHAAQAAAMAQASTVKQARFQHDLRAQQLARFHSTLGDGLLFGMVVMLASAAVCGFWSGVGDLLVGHCRPMSSCSTFSLFRPWAALEAGAVLVCWAGAVSDVLVAMSVMLLVGRHMAAAGVLVGAHGAPLRKLALGLGAGCGAAGFFVVRRVHGDARRWLLGWEAWVALQLLVAWFMPSVLHTLARQPAAGATLSVAIAGGGPKGRAKWAQSLGLPIYHAMMVLLIPAAVGYAPFSRRLSMVHLRKSLLASL